MNILIGSRNYRAFIAHIHIPQQRDAQREWLQYDKGYGLRGEASATLKLKVIFPLFIGLFFLKRFNQFEQLVFNPIAQ